MMHLKSNLFIITPIWIAVLSMDSVPSDVSLQILSYLSGNDVFRFKQLNKNFREVIKENKHQLRRPIVTVRFSRTDEAIIMEIQGVPPLRKCRFVFDEYFNRIVETNLQNTDVHPFVLSFCEEDLMNLSLPELFTNVLENTEVHLVVNKLYTRSFILMVKKVIEEARSRIHSVRTSHRVFRSNALFNLVELTAKTAKRRSGLPVLYVECNAPFTPEEWMGLDRMNYLSECFHRTILEFDKENLVISMVTIAQSWRARPFTTFHFCVRVTNAVGFEGGNYIQSSRILRNGDIQFFSINHLIDSMWTVSFRKIFPFIRLVDRRNGSSIQFEKTQEPNSQYTEGDYLVGVFISITTKIA